MTDDPRRASDRKPLPPPAPDLPPPGATRTVEDVVATARSALASTQTAVRSTREAVADARTAIARTKEALAQSRAELRGVAELAARESSGVRLSRAESRALTRERLLDAATDVFNRLGYHGASLEAVAEAAGYTKGAVYSNFATKGDLFLALHHRYTGRRITDQDAALADLSLEQLAEQGGAALVEQARSQETWDLLQIEFWLAAMRDPELRAAMVSDNEQLWEEVGARFAEKLERAGVERFTGVEFVKLVNALGSGLLLQLYIDPSSVEPTLFARAIRALLGLPPGMPAPADPGADAESTGSIR